MPAPCSGCERLAADVQRLRELLREAKAELARAFAMYEEVVKLVGLGKAGL